MTTKRYKSGKKATTAPLDQVNIDRDNLTTREVKAAAKVISENIAQEVKRKGIKALPLGARVAMANALSEEDFSVRRIARVLGVDMTTAQRYVNTDVDDKHKRYAMAIKEHMTDVNDGLRYLTAQKIADKLNSSDEIKLRDLAGLYKITNDVTVQQAGGSSNKGTTVQILNVHPALNRSKDQ